MGRKTRRQALSSRPSVNQRRKSRRQLGFKKKGPLITHATSLGKLEWDKNLTLKQVS